MAQLIGEQKVYSEFLTNLAVAWFSAGVIGPFLARPKNVREIVSLSLAGVLGALLSLRFAVLTSKGGKR